MKKMRQLSKFSLGLLLLATLIAVTLCDCPRPQDPIANGRYVFQSPFHAKRPIFANGYVIKFKCNEGYRTDGQEAILCYRETWAGKVPQCKRRHCGYPPNIPDSRYNLLDAPGGTPYVNSTAVYVCNHGFELDDPNNYELLCQWDKIDNKTQWVGHLPKCNSLMSCKDPDRPLHGYRIGPCCMEGNVLQYYCHDKYTLVGESTMQCLATGNWTQRKRPKCRPNEEDTCETPPPIENGVVRGPKEGDFYAAYDEVEVLCQPGFRYAGESVFVSCQEDGTWDSDFSYCEEAKCARPPDLLYGSIPEVEALPNTTLFPYDFELSYQCQTGYRLIGDSWRFCKERGWSGKEDPYCEEIRCPNPGFPEHGTRLGSNFSIGAKVSFKCFSTYQLIGSVERYCSANGQWTGQLARCNHDRNDCPDPGVPINGFKNSSSYQLGSTILFSCSSGYTLLGSDVRTCKPDGTWTGLETKCSSPYDFDDTNRVGQVLKAAIQAKVDEQKRQREEFEKAVVDAGKTLQTMDGETLVLYFAFDASNSVGRKNFEESVSFAKAIVKKIGISEDGARAGALTFSAAAKVEFFPINFDTTEDVIKAMDNMNFTGGGTSANSALETIRVIMMPQVQRSLVGKTIKSVIFILTDGKANMGGDPQEQAQILKRAGVEIYCVGITNSVSRDSLDKIASEEKSEHVFFLENYKTYQSLAQEIVNGSIDYSNCGIGPPNLGVITANGKVVGGNVTKEPWPWMAALYFKNPSVRNELFKLHCGGSIINRNYILTAAHCLHDTTDKYAYKQEDIRVKLGLTDVTNTTTQAEYEVQQIRPHPSFDIGRGNYDFDIALLKVSRPIEYSDFIRPICLPDVKNNEGSNLYAEGEYAVAVGWGHEGQLKPGQSPKQWNRPHELKEVFLKLQTKYTCNRSLDTEPMQKYTFTNRMICAGNGYGQYDTCHGDSGGPLMQSLHDIANGVFWTQVGITSWGIGCAQPDKHGFYTDVRELMPWVESVAFPDDGSKPQRKRLSQKLLEKVKKNREKIIIGFNRRPPPKQT